VWLVLCLGVAVGLAEVFLVLGKKAVTGRFIWLSPQMIWMTPLAYAGWLSLAALPVGLLAHLRPNAISYPVAIGLLLIPGLVGLGMLFPLYEPAVLLLALGLAVQVARQARRNPDRARRLSRRVAMWGGGLVVAGGIGLNAVDALSSASMRKNLPPARAGSPNVLLIILDTVRASGMSLHGYARQTTPGIDEFARRGVVFERAFSQSPWTLPSHASAFTSRLPSELSASWLTPLDAAYPTLAETLADRGYATAGFVGNLFYCGYEMGLDRGFVRYEDYEISFPELLLSSSIGRRIVNDSRVRRAINYYDIVGRKNAREITDSFLNWWRSGDTGERPFFAFLNYYDAHEPYLPPPPFDSLFGPSSPRRLHRNDHVLRNATLWGRRGMSPEMMAIERSSYDGALAYIDQQLGRVFQELDSAGALENTIVVITSDHGEHFGEHELHGHGTSLYTQELWVPLLIVHGEVLSGGSRIAAPASLRDLPVTILSMIGSDGHGFQGVSLDRHWTEASASHADTVLSEFTETDGRRMASVLAGRFHFIRNYDDSEELYDVVADPEEVENLIDLPELQADRLRLRESLQRRLPE
jgi:arylsulfatase A-like enzyme